MSNKYSTEKTAKILKQTRHKTKPKLTQEKITHLLGYEQRSTYANYENGKVEPSLDTIYKLCDIFECDIGYLFGEYPMKTRELSDVYETTGLSKNAVAKIVAFKDYDGTTEINMETGKVRNYKNNSHGLSLLLENDDELQILSNIARFLFSDFGAVAPIEKNTGQREIVNEEYMNEVFLLRIVSGLRDLKKLINNDNN